MSTVPVPSTPHTTSSRVPAQSRARCWIVGSWADLFLIILTPLLAIPAILMLSSSWVGVRAETISLIVTAFFATGHHLPGLIRAYGDHELFQRFRWRFVLAPPLVFLAYFPLSTYHIDLYRLIILTWATWHGLMQLYGFVRIYDSKVGSVSRITANLDWLICLCGFVTPQLLRPETLSRFLGHWYALGGAVISVQTLDTIRWSGIAVSVAVLMGFTANYLMQLYLGPKPSPLKLLMLVSGIGMWWFSMLFIDNLILGVALFDICHDVQYLAIVWLFNNRRVNANPHIGRFMRLVFRRGMVLLYLALIIAYGAIGLVASQSLDSTVNSVAYAVLFTSTILHYYYDGFIWKVRETANQVSLGLSPNDGSSRIRQIRRGEFTHLLKCAPILLVLGLLFTTDLLEPTLTTAQKAELNARYSQSLSGRSVLPHREDERSWLYARFEQAENIAAAVPDDRNAQVRAAIMLANFGRNAEAIERLSSLLKRHPHYYNAQLVLGGIYNYLGETTEASECFQRAVSYAATPEERSVANLNLGEVCLHLNDAASAESKFQAALRDDPKAAVSIDDVRQRNHSRQVAPY